MSFMCIYCYCLPLDMYWWAMMSSINVSQWWTLSHRWWCILAVVSVSILSTLYCLNLFAMINYSLIATFCWYAPLKHVKYISNRLPDLFCNQQSTDSRGDLWWYPIRPPVPSETGTKMCPRIWSFIFLMLTRK